jgi:hypothetical protein
VFSKVFALLFLLDWIFLWILRLVKPDALIEEAPRWSASNYQVKD